MSWKNAAQLWQEMDSERSPLLTRVERLSQLTLPHILLPLGASHENTAITHDYESFGAQAVTHLTNKLSLTLFRPGIPFFKLAPTKEGKKALADNGQDATDIASILSAVEIEAVSFLDTSGQRPKLNLIIENLLVAGNVCFYAEDTTIRCFTMRNWVVKRNYKQEVIRLIIREEICADELDEKVRPYAYGASDETKVCWYKLIERKGQKMEMTQWVNEVMLPKDFNGSWPVAKCPYHVAAWNIPDDSNYGIGLVQLYWGDLEAISALAEAITDGGVVGTEMRWAVDPTSQSRPEDLNKSRNGDFIPARKDDINPLFGGNHEAVQTADAILQRKERRVGMGFLMQSATVRDAERVTAEELRLQAVELETAYGGNYTAIAKDVQGPVADWCLEGSGNSLSNQPFEARVITGLDALTRNAELEAVRAAFSDLGMTAALPPLLQARIKWNPFVNFVGAGRGAPTLGKYIMSDEEFASMQQADQASRVNEQGAMDANKAQAQAQAQPQQ